MNIKKGFLFLVLMTGLGVEAWGQEATKPGSTPFNLQAEKILRETFQKYQQCKTYQDEATLTIVMLNKEKQNQKSFDAGLIFVRPNKMRFIWPSVNLVCDGTRCQMVYPDFKQYLNREAPAVINQSFMKEVLMEDYLPFTLNGLIGEKPYDTAVKTMQRLDYRGTVEKDGKKYYRINYSEGADNVDVLIDTKTLLIDRVNISPQKAKSRKWELRIVYKNIVMNASVPDSVFKITEPKDVRKVDRISFTRQYDYPKLGQRIPEMALDVFGTNRKTNVGKLLGSKLTFVTFWATWCPPCRGELPEMERLYLEYQPKGFQVLGINLDQEEAEAEVKKVVNDMKLTFPILLDPDSKLAETMMVQSIPTLLILDANGKILEAHVGTSPNSIREFKGIIEKTINETVPQKSVK